MLYEAFYVHRLVTTLPTMPGVGYLVPQSVGFENGLAGELLVAELAGVGDHIFMGIGNMFNQLPLLTSGIGLTTMWAGDGLRSTWGKVQPLSRG